MFRVSDLDALDVDGLLQHVDVDPASARSEAVRRMASTEDPIELAGLYWVVGLCDRETGELESARVALTSAADLAETPPPTAAELEALRALHERTRRAHDGG